MFAPFFDLVENDTAVKEALGDPVRVYSFGSAPQNVATPYAVWQVVGGGPENFLAGRPDHDVHIVQVDVYGPATANGSKQAKDATSALVRAIELQGYVTSWNGEFREPDTKLFRISFTAEFITPR